MGTLPAETTNARDSAGDALAKDQANEQLDDLSPKNKTGKCKKNLKGKILGWTRKIKPKTKPNRDSSPQALTFEEYLKLRRISEAGQQLISLEEKLYRYADGSENQEEALKEEEELKLAYETFSQDLWTTIAAGVTLSGEELKRLASAVRSIEQEEERDKKCLEEKERNGRIPQWRPRECRKELDTVLQKAVELRMEDILEVMGAENLSSIKQDIFKMGKRVKEDLLSVVMNVKSCYPKGYDICNVYAKLYHIAFSSQLKKITEFGLGQEDCTYVLGWVHNYYQNDILKHRDLEKEIDGKSLGSLLPEDVIKQLESQYVSSRESEIKQWLSKAVGNEVTKWMEGEIPEQMDGFYHSEIAIDVIQSIVGAVKEAKEVLDEEFGNMMHVVMWALQELLERYKKTLEDFIKDKEKHKNCAAVIKANMFNCKQFRDYIEKTNDPFEAEDKEKCLSVLSGLEGTGYRYLADLMHLPLKPYYKVLITQEWLTSSKPVMDNILHLAEKQIQEFKKLKPCCFQELLKRLHFEVIAEYSKRIMKKKIKLKSEQQQTAMAEKICDDNRKIQELFTCYESKEDWLHHVLPKVAEVIKLQDLSMIVLETATLVRDYPDISEKHLSALLHIKANLHSKDVKSIKKVLQMKKEDLNSCHSAKSFFALVPVS
ncbi:tumor necrosis factor alpha-induced protein 2-like isoform X1 [Acipenser ruthenus]|uniref:tumor necrosis factor alpha-induced protein 2-like isoform X1 n=1 Tax=Acipenser ruthenus TaxID=7906 RepID=UPI00274216E7|nr:tumor necrosis factor alpha-induced protein 2-like isoform X1 [Acipenser ruthenus]